MFNVDDMVDKISELRLSDIVEMGATDSDYECTDCEEYEIKRPVRVRFNYELVHKSGILLDKFNCSSNTFYKSATKLGAMILENNEYIKIISDVKWFANLITDVAYLSGDETFIELVDMYLGRIANCSSILVSKEHEPLVDKSIYPYPKWRRILDKYAYLLFVPKSVIYRGAIALAMNTEIKVKTAEEFNKKLNIYATEILNTTQTCVVFKNCAGFIKNKEYIVSRVSRKSLSSRAKEVIDKIIE